MMGKLGDLLEEAKKLVKKPVLAIAGGEDETVLLAAKNAQEMGITECLIFGDTGKIEEISRSVGVDPSVFDVIHAHDSREAVRKAVESVAKGDASLLMKGKVKTAEIMSEVLKEEYGLRTSRLLNMVSVFEIANYPRLLIVADAGMVISPTLEQKVDMIHNCVLVAKVLGIKMPKVAVVGAVETVNPKMPVTIDAAALAKMCDRKQIKDAIVDGPLALDNAVSEKAAKHKGIESEVAGKADILILPDIEAANIFYKSLVFLAGAKVASTIVGARVPVVLTSRADSDETKLLSIALTVLVSAKG